MATIEVKINDEDIGDICLGNRKNVDAANKSIRRLEKKLDGALKRINEQNTTITELQQEIIHMNTAETKERKSLWDFLSKGKPEKAKPSRLTQSSVHLDK